jgi:hypothetical protein
VTYLIILVLVLVAVALLASLAFALLSRERISDELAHEKARRVEDVKRLNTLIYHLQQRDGNDV